MSDGEQPQAGRDGERGDEPGSDEPDGSEPNSGPNLTLLYSLIALALAAAIGLAALIVRPFYLRR
jgi:hypothetical protein